MKSAGSVQEWFQAFCDRREVNTLRKSFTSFMWKLPLIITAQVYLRKIAGSFVNMEEQCLKFNCIMKLHIIMMFI